MKKTNKRLIIIGLIIVALISLVLILNLSGIKIWNNSLAVTGTSSPDFEKDSSELIYKTHKLVLGEGICLATNNPSWGGGWINYTSKVYFEDGKIKVQQIILNQNGENNRCGIYFGYLSYWNFQGFCGSKEEYTPCGNNFQNINAVVDDCQSLGIIDTGTTLKCNGYCKPNQNVCYKRTQDDAWESHSCTSDGSTILHKICPLGCSNGVCIGEGYSENPIKILTENVPDGSYGLDYSLPIKVYFNNNPYLGAVMTAKLIQVSTGQTIQESSYFTDQNGYANIVFKKVTSYGNMKIIISTKIRNVAKSITYDTYFNEATPIFLYVDPLKTNYRFREDVGVNILSKAGSNVYSGAEVYSKLVNSKTGAVIQESNCTTDSYGECLINFKRVEFIGEAKIISTNRFLTKEYTAESSTIIFEGNPYISTVSSSSLVQYDSEPVTFQANIQDAYGKFISPDLIQNLKVISTISGGSVTGSTVKYLGSGDYLATVSISGSGNLVGKIQWTYNGQTFNTEPITIEVRKDAISIDTSKIDPSGTLKEPKTMQIKVTSATGKAITPEAMTIEVTHPSGTQKEVFSISSLLQRGNGTYDFTYSGFTEVEKYTFNFIADKDGYVRGNAMASVSVGGKEGSTDGMAGTPVIGIIVSNIKWIGILSVVIIIIVVWRLKKRKNGKK